jgi:DNA repair exonuclease SbcCD ATPase subunit
MRLRTLRVDGFGRISGRTFAFGPGLNVVVGRNEAGKSTLAAAIVASLYGLGRGEKDRWRPWDASPYGTALTYETADGASWEVHRAFDRDAKGVRVFDGDGADAAARLGTARSLSPGEAHLHISQDVFVQTACARQRAVGLDAGSAGDVSSALAQALSGGPKEDAALGALTRLEDALRKHVGTERAHKNAPLRKLREREQQQAREAAEARAALDALADLRERIAAERVRGERDAAAAAELERRTRSLRAAHVRARLDALKEYRDELAALQRARAAFDDVAAFAAERVSALDDAYHSWRNAESVAEAAARDVAQESLDAQEWGELAARREDAGRLDDAAFDALRAAAAQAEAARARSAAAAHEAAVARRDGEGGKTFAGALVAAALAGTAADVGVAIAHLWLWMAIVTVVAALLGIAATGRARTRAGRTREADAKQRMADAALADERTAAAAVAGVLEPLGVASMDELVRRRERFVALAARENDALKAEARARTARDAALAEAERFDGLADALVPDAGGDRAARRDAARTRAQRRRELDGLDARLAMLKVQRETILQGDDEFALQAEYAALLAAGAEPAAENDPQSLRALEAERGELDAHARDAEKTVASLEGALRAGEEKFPDVAALDEALAATRAEIARLDGFKRAVELARSTIDARKEEAHRAFARRLEEYAAGVLGTITGGRYAELRLDPATLAIRVRVPETGVLEETDKLSAGTRDQIALVVRFAMARMFAEGLETPPLILDDPFAFWDAERIARCLPVLVRGAETTQCVLFTASTELANAAGASGATIIELGTTPVAAAR